MDGLPIIAHQSADAVVAYRAGQPVSARQFLADVERLSACLPGGHVLNLCSDRYLFAVGLAATMVAGKVSLLPPTHLPEVVRHLKRLAPDAICLTDRECDIDLPTVLCPGTPAPLAHHWQVPLVPRERHVASVFTSGSTGMPQPHEKSWGQLVSSVQVEARRIGLTEGGTHVLIATVPPQHMYGLESSVLLPLQSGQAFCAERPFYPADIAGIAGGVPRSRVLVSTPVHLTALLATNVQLPAIDLVLSATAPLAATLASDVESRLRAPLLEIYGSTETGQIASRRTTRQVEWQLWPEVTMTVREGRTWAQGGHVEAGTPLGDLVEITAPDRFRLLGRIEDLVNIAGKRNSLANLNRQLLALAGVSDGVFFVHEAARGRTATPRLGALVVAPSLAAKDILRQLRERIDPVFLPRPLLLVDRVPRNATGKVPRAALLALLERSHTSRPATRTSVAIRIPADHPAFAGHFPGRPIVPGVVLLDHALHAIAATTGICLHGCVLSAAKFLRVVLPGEPLALDFELAARDLRFAIRSADALIATGSLTLAADVHES